MGRSVKAEIEVSGHGRDGRVVLDGHDVTNGVRGFVLRAGVDCVTELELDVVAADGATFDGEVRLVIPESTRDALVALGWTPPEE